MLGQKSTVDTKRIIELLEGFDANAKPSNLLMMYRVNAIIEGEKSRLLEPFNVKPYTRYSNSYPIEKSAEIEAQVESKYYTIEARADGTKEKTPKPEEMAKLKSQAQVQIQQEMERYRNTLDPVSHMTFGDYIAKARNLVKDLEAGKALSKDDTAFLKAFSKRVNDDSSSLLMDLSDQNLPSPPEKDRFFDMPNDKFARSPVFSQWVGFGGGEHLEVFKGLSAALIDHERRGADQVRQMKAKGLEPVGHGFSLQNTKEDLFNYVTNANWSKETRDGKPVMVATIDYPEGLFDPAPFKEMAKEKGLTSFVEVFKKREGPMLREINPADPPPSPFQLEVSVSREEYNNLLSPVINMPLLALKAGQDDYDPDTKSYVVAVPESSVPKLLKLLEREDVAAKTEPGALKMDIIEQDFKSKEVQEFLKAFDSVLLPGRLNKASGQYIVTSKSEVDDVTFKTMQERADALKKLQVDVSLIRETNFSVSKAEYENSVAPLIERMENRLRALQPQKTKAAYSPDTRKAVLEAIAGLGGEAVGVPDKKEPPKTTLVRPGSFATV